MTSTVIVSHKNTEMPWRLLKAKADENNAYLDVYLFLLFFVDTQP